VAVVLFATVIIPNQYKIIKKQRIIESKQQEILLITMEQEKNLQEINKFKSEYKKCEEIIMPNANKNAQELREKNDELLKQKKQLEIELHDIVFQ